MLGEKDGDYFQPDCHHRWYGIDNPDDCLVVSPGAGDVGAVDGRPSVIAVLIEAIVEAWKGV